MSDLQKALNAATAKMKKAEKTAITAKEKLVAKPDDEKLAASAEKAIEAHQVAVAGYDQAKAALHAEPVSTSTQDPAQASGNVITIKAKPKNGFWRCGVKHPPEAVEHPIEKFTEEEWKRLRGDPRLIVTE